MHSEDDCVIYRDTWRTWKKIDKENKSWQCERHSLEQDFKVNKILKIEEPNLECYEVCRTLYLEGERSHLAVDQQVEKIKRLL